MQDKSLKEHIKKANNVEHVENNLRLYFLKSKFIKLFPEISLTHPKPNPNKAIYFKLSYSNPIKLPKK
jgi:hypothetical protein